VSKETITQLQLYMSTTDVKSVKEVYLCLVFIYYIIFLRLEYKMLKVQYSLICIWWHGNKVCNFYVWNV